MTLSISAISPDIISRDGGSIIELAGTFSTDQVYEITVDSIVAYSGVPGQGNAIYTEGSLLSFVLPEIDIGSIGSLTVQATSSPGAETDTISLSVIEKPFRSTMLDIRRMFPSWCGVGARRIELEPREF